MSNHLTNQPVQYKSLDFLGFPDYRVGDDGSVWSRRVYGSRARRIGPWWQMKLKWNKSKVKRYYVDLFKEVGKPVRWYVHTLVLIAFVGSCPEGQIGRHLNDVATDNRLVNLAYGTHGDNSADAIRNGKTHCGERQYKAKLTNDQVREIRRLIQEGRRYREIGERFGVSRHYIAKIACREIWKHII